MAISCCGSDFSVVSWCGWAASGVPFGVLLLLLPVYPHRDGHRGEAAFQGQCGRPFLARARRGSARLGTLGGGEGRAGAGAAWTAEHGTRGGLLAPDCESRLGQALA